MLPPLDLAATLPVLCQRRIHLIAELALTSKRSAASRRDAPDSTVSSTRSRKSKEQGFVIDPPPKIESMPPDSIVQTSQEILRFNPAETYFKLKWQSMQLIRPCANMARCGPACRFLICG
jgi:hypothetical protein